MKRSARSLFTLFWGILCVNAFTFGGGFVIVTVLKRKFVDELHWLSEEEMLDYVEEAGLDAVELGTGNYPGDAHCNPDELLSDCELEVSF